MRFKNHIKKKESLAYCRDSFFIIVIYGAYFVLTYVGSKNIVKR